LISLPPAISEVSVPDYFSPSALGSASECRLKLVLASSPAADHFDRLAAGPEAMIGTLMHKVLERAAKEPDASPEQIFESEYEQIIDRIRRDPRRSQYVELASTRSRAEWVATKARILSNASRREASQRSGGFGSSGRSRTLGPEVLLERRDIRLRGKADRIAKIGSGEFEIRDYKTGIVLDKLGRIKREIEIQLLAYGLLFLKGHPGARIRLVVDDGQEREVAFEPEQQRDALEELSTIMSAIPPPGPTTARNLAQPGHNCWGCSVRHVCSSYREIAPRWWTRYPKDVRLSNDLWGTALDVKGNENMDIVMSDEADRRVRISGLDTRHGVTRATIGKRIWMFGLEATGPTASFSGAKAHPRNFHEHPRDGLERRAWTLEVFESSGAG
jgi:RecB family exonuclease